MVANPITPVPFDPELLPVIEAMSRDGSDSELTLDAIPAMREGGKAMSHTVAEVIAGRPLIAEERTIPGPDASSELAVTILRRADATAGTPGLYNMHGGGLIMGDRFMDTARVADLVEEFGFTALNVEYRLAPEHPGLTPMEDCYAGLLWMIEHARELGLDSERIVVAGGSAGGLLSASMALMSRDRGGPRLAGQLLLVPMLDDRSITVSSHQYPSVGPWSRAINVLSWQAVLGEHVGTDGVSPYIAPSRATNLGGLAPAYIELGSAETLRDETVEYASRIWAAGGQAELHVWAGGFHGFEVFAPRTKLAAAALSARSSWLHRLLD